MLIGIHFKCSLTGALLLLLLFQAVAQPMQEIPNTLGGNESIALSVSADGSVIVGYVLLASNQRKAFRWTEATGMQQIVSGDVSSSANDVSDDGLAVVGWNYDKAFRWTQVTGMQEIPNTIGGYYSSASAVSADGSIVVGHADIAGQRRIFRWTQTAGMEDLGALEGYNTYSGGVSDDGSIIVGTTQLNNEYAFAIVWTQATGVQALPNTLGGFDSSASEVSADGSVIVGRATNGGRINRPFRWTQTTGMQDIAPLIYEDSTANDVSSNGLVVVGAAPWTFLQERAFRWTPTGGLKQIVNTLGGARAVATSVSADGWTVVGYAYNSSGQRRAFRWKVNIPFGDINQDGCVNDFDLASVIFDFGAPPSGNNGNSDVTGPNGIPDGIVNHLDLTAVITHFGDGC